MIIQVFFRIFDARNGIVEEAGLREALLSALDMLAGKRVPTVAKKHGTV